MDNQLLLLSGNDIPFIEAEVTIHQPTIKEIAYIGEEAFFTGCELINFSKDVLPEQDKIKLENYSNFDVLLAILEERNAVMQKNRNCLELLLALIFPWYTIEITKRNIKLSKEEENHYIDDSNFEVFKNIINEIFCYSKNSTKRDYNPAGDLAKKIIEKLKKRTQILSEIKKEENKKINFFGRYISILTVGENKDMNSLFQLSVYQLYDEYERFRLKTNSDLHIQVKLAGGNSEKEVEDWMKDIHAEKTDEMNDLL